MSYQARQLLAEILLEEAQDLASSPLADCHAIVTYHAVTLACLFSNDRILSRAGMIEYQHLNPTKDPRQLVRTIVDAWLTHHTETIEKMKAVWTGSYASLLRELVAWASPEDVSLG